MSEYGWFRLLLRVCGLLLMGLCAPTVANSIGWFLTVVSNTGSFASGPYVSMYVSMFIGAALQGGLGAYLYFGGGWIVKRCLGEVQGRCPGCGYDLGGVTGELCPECGMSIGRRPTSATVGNSANIPEQTGGAAPRERA